MQLGFGTGANFVLSPLNDGLDFDTGPPGGNDTPPTSAAFGTISRPDEDQLLYSGGLHGSGAQPYQMSHRCAGRPHATIFAIYVATDSDRSSRAGDVSAAGIGCGGRDRRSPATLIRFPESIEKASAMPRPFLCARSRTRSALTN